MSAWVFASGYPSGIDGGSGHRARGGEKERVKELGWEVGERLALGQ